MNIFYVCIIFYFSPLIFLNMCSPTQVMVGMIFENIPVIVFFVIFIGLFYQIRGIKRETQEISFLLKKNSNSTFDMEK